MEVPFAELRTQIGLALARPSGTAPGKGRVKKHHHLVRQVCRDVLIRAPMVENSRPETIISTAPR